MRTQSGFGHVVLIMAILVVAVAGFAGYSVLHRNQPASSQAATTAASAAVPATIETKADLSATSKALDGTAVQADAQLDDSGLDADVDALL